MIRLYLTVLNMSIGASFCILAVMLLRILLMRAPKIFSYLLWLAVLIRLICPVLPEAEFGLIPNISVAEKESLTIRDTDNFNMPAEISATNMVPGTDLNAGAEEVIPSEADNTAHTYEQSVKTKAFQINIGDHMLAGASAIWAGVALLLISYVVVSYGIFMSYVAEKKIITPFVAGLIHPAIYLPEELEGTKRQLVWEHENMHIKRMDHLIKPAAFLVCCIHWFNPMVWVFCFLMERDMESSCDEAVIRKIGYDRRRDYANILLELSESRRWGSGYPIAFGENHVKSRIKGVMKMKKAGSRIMASGALLVLLAAVLMLVKQPAENEKERDDGDFSPENVVVLPEEKITVQTLPVAPSAMPDILEDEDVIYEYLPQIDSQELQSFSAGNQETDMNYDPDRERDQYEILLLPQTDEAFNALGILFSYPVKGARISDTFGSRVHPVTQEERVHLGIDFAADEGTTIMATADGTVVKTGNDTVCGNYVVLLHENGDATYYFHCSEIMVEEGKWVERGWPIAAVGNTGNSTGSHLHFAVSRNGTYIEPEFITEDVIEN